MKYFFIYSFLAVGMIFQAACQKTDEQMGNGNGKPTFFATPEEAATKAKSDLLAVLRSARNVSLGLNQSALESSQPARPIQHYQVTFEQLLSGQGAAFSALRGNEMGMVVPFVADNKVVTVAEIGKHEKGWSVASLVDKNVTDELNALRRAAPEAAQGEITIYDLPHSGLKVYEVPGGMLHTSYPGFALEQGVPADRLLEVLKRDAAEFQRQHGEALKARKLVR